jgi:hypothetical protein
MREYCREPANSQPVPHPECVGVFAAYDFNTRPEGANPSKCLCTHADKFLRPADNCAEGCDMGGTQHEDLRSSPRLINVFGYVKISLG